MTLRGTVAALLGVAGLVAGCDASAPAAPVAGSGSSRASAAPSVSSATRTPAVRPGSLLSQDPRLLPPQPIVGVDPSASGSSVAGVGVPVRLRIPSIGVDATVMRLGRDASGAMQTPPEWQVPGWYADGPRPGQVGPAVIVGHVDSVGGPAVFFRLPELRIGDRVYVTDADGRTRRFVVDDRQTFVKARFPSRLVYGPQASPVLRLITCTGAFDAVTGSYLSNLVVSAHLG